MHFHILTLFPEMITQALNTSIIGRAVQRGCISIDAVNIRDYTADRHNKTDDYPYGGGAGMVMQAQPVYDCCRAVQEKIDAKKGGGTGEKAKVIYLTPSTAARRNGTEKKCRPSCCPATMQR